MLCQATGLCPPEYGFLGRGGPPPPPREGPRERGGEPPETEARRQAPPAPPQPPPRPAPPVTRSLPSCWLCSRCGDPGCSAAVPPCCVCARRRPGAWRPSGSCPAWHRSYWRHWDGSASWSRGTAPARAWTQRRPCARWPATGTARGRPSAPGTAAGPGSAGAPWTAAARRTGCGRRASRSRPAGPAPGTEPCPATWPGWAGGVALEVRASVGTSG